MSEEHEYALGELDRRLGNVLRFGTVAAVDAAGALVTVDLGGMVTGWVPWLAERAGDTRLWAPPSVGEQVVLLSSGDPSQGVAIGGLYQTAHPANGNATKDWRITFKDGTLIELDTDASALNVQVAASGNIRLNVGSSTLQIQNGAATLTADAINLNSTSLTHNGKNIGATHVHSGVMPGGGNTGAPV